MKKSDKRIIWGLYYSALFTLFFVLGFIGGDMLGLLALGLAVTGVFMFERGDIRPWITITVSSVGFASGVCVVVIWIGGISATTVLSWAAGAVALFYFLVWIGFRQERHSSPNS